MRFGQFTMCKSLTKVAKVSERERKRVKRNRDSERERERSSKGEQ